MLTEKPPAGAAALDVKVSVEILPAESFSAAGLAATETVGAGGTVKFSVALPVILRGFVIGSKICSQLDMNSIYHRTIGYDRKTTA